MQNPQVLTVNDGFVFLSYISLIVLSKADLAVSTVIAEPPKIISFVN